MGEETKKHNDSKLMRRLLIGIAIVFAILIFAGVVGNNSLKTKEDKAIKECVAIERLQDDMIAESTGTELNKKDETRWEMCRNLLKEVGRDQFLKDIETSKSDNKDLTANGHNLDWYIEHIDD